MQYELTLLEADLRTADTGSFRIGLGQGGQVLAEMAYDWDPSRFSAVFHGNAAELPLPAHPTVFLHQALSEVRALQSDSTPKPTDVFATQQVFLTPNP